MDNEFDRLRAARGIGDSYDRIDDIELGGWGRFLVAVIVGITAATVGYLLFAHVV